MNRTLIVTIIAASLAQAACLPVDKASAKHSPTPSFPSREALEKIAEQPMPAALFEQSKVQAAAYQFEGEQPLAPAAAFREDDDLARGLARVAKAHGVSLSGNLQCAARSLARFAARHKGPPSDGLRRFMLGRCGVVSSEVVAMPALLPVRGDDEAALIKGFVSGIDKGLGKQTLPPSLRIAAAAAREGETLALVVAREEPSVEITSIEVKADEAIVSGKALGPVEWLAAEVNRGRFDTSFCLPEPLVAPPSFKLRCPFSPQDATSWVTVQFHRPGRFVNALAAHLLLTRDEGAIATYRAPDLGRGEVARDEKTLTQSFVKHLNDIRAQAGRKPVTLAQQQSAMNKKLVGALAQAMSARDDATSDTIAMGLLAGWDVPGIIRDGQLFVTIQPGEPDVLSLLAAELEQPTGRSVLLSPTVSKIAIGPFLSPKGVGAVVTGYSIFEGADHAAEEGAMHQRIDRDRVARGLPRLRRHAVPGLAEQLERVREGKASIGEALRSSLPEAQALGPAEAFTFATHDLEHLTLPDQALSPDIAALAVGITHRRENGAAWGHYEGVLLLFHASGGSASLAPPARVALASPKAR